MVTSADKKTIGKEVSADFPLGGKEVFDELVEFFQYMVIHAPKVARSYPKLSKAQLILNEVSK